LSVKYYLLGLTVFSGILVLVNNENAISKCSGKQLVETVSNEIH
jgi:hypothetical protein